MADISSLLGGIGGSTIGKAIVSLELDTAKYNAEMKATEAQTSKFAGVAKAAVLGIGVAAVAGIAIAIKAGSDLNEQLNKSRVVFGQAADSVIRFSETTATGLGIAQSEALEAAGNFGQLFQAAGFAEEAAAGMSTKMVELSADLGSFNNIPVAEALEKIRSGLAGEAEPLRQLGVFLSEAAVEAEAFRSGIAEQGEELTDAQKIQARYNIILDSTTKAQGDFARTVGESLPNQLKVFKAELTDVAANLGIALLPIVLEVVKAFKVLVPLLKFAADNLGLVLTALAGFAAFKYLPGLLTGIAEGMASIGAVGLGVRLISVAEGVTAAGVAFGTAAPLAAGFAVAFAGLTAALAAWDPLDLVIDDTRQLREQMEVHDVVLGRVARSTNLVGESNAVWGTSSIETADRVGELEQAAELAQGRITNLAHTTAHTSHEVLSFFDKTGQKAKEWRAKINDSIDSNISDLGNLSHRIDITKEDFVEGMRAMADRARKMAKALEELRDEDWINKRFLDFLTTQGPEAIVGFEKLNDEKQHAMQKLWLQTADDTDRAHRAVKEMSQTLDGLDKGATKHDIIFQYHYEGFDPSKPGMSAQQR